MTRLSEQPCEACRADAPKLTEAECQQLLSELPGWSLQHAGATPMLVKTYTFKNFVEALNFTNRVGELAELHNHHPAILTEWGKVTLSWWTHKIGGLHRNDFILAAKTEAAFEGALH